MNGNHHVFWHLISYTTLSRVRRKAPIHEAEHHNLYHQLDFGCKVRLGITGSVRCIAFGLGLGLGCRESVCLERWPHRSRRPEKIEPPDNCDTLGAQTPAAKAIVW